jgi:hypothetical protein
MRIEKIKELAATAGFDLQEDGNFYSPPQGQWINQEIYEFAKLVIEEFVPESTNSNCLIYRLQERARIRRQIPGRKSVEENKPDRIADLLDEAATELLRYRPPPSLATINQLEELSTLRKAWAIPADHLTTLLDDAAKELKRFQPLHEEYQNALYSADYKQSMGT